MKKAIFTLLIIFATVSAFAQSMPPVQGIPLATPEDYRAAENIVVQVAGNLLSTPIDQATEQRLYAGVFFIKWMDGTPDYDFAKGEKVMKYIENDVDLISVYYAALSSFAIQYKSVKDPKTVTLNAVKKFVAYIDNSNNHVKMTRRLKKLSEANQKGELESFLKL